MMSDLVKEMELYAKTYDIPIMQVEGLDFMCTFIKEHDIKRILEIGSAIGYSALQMAMLDEAIEIVTIERDDERYQKAVEYVNRSDCFGQIRLVHEDALDSVITEQFDLLFIDAAKAQYIKFFERYEKNVVQDGYIITDNLQFHGFVDHPEKAMSRNLRQLVTKIARFNDYLTNRKDYETSFIDKGDGIGISRKL